MGPEGMWRRVGVVVRYANAEETADPLWLHRWEDDGGSPKSPSPYSGTLDAIGEVSGSQTCAKGRAQSPTRMTQPSQERLTQDQHHETG